MHEAEISVSQDKEGFTEPQAGWMLRARVPSFTREPSSLKKTVKQVSHHPKRNHGYLIGDVAMITTIN